MIKLIVPELLVLLTACTVLMGSVCLPKPRCHTWVYYTTQLGLLGALFSTILLLTATPIVAWQSALMMDAFTALLKSGVYAVAVFAIAYARSYVDEHQLPLGEFYALVLLSIVGMTVLISAHNLLIVFLGLELFSLPMYALVAIRSDSSTATEAAMKYFVMGALATGILLYGCSLLYGVTHSMDLSVIAKAVQQPSHMTLFSMVFIVVGIAFKLGVVPFHMWVPDVYAGAPTPVAALIASAAKLATFGLLVHVLVGVLSPWFVHWQTLLMILAVLSIGIGNIAAVVQTQIRRLLAYSAIAHMGYMLLGFIAMGSQGVASALFYILTYALMGVAAFGLLLVLQQKKNHLVAIQDLAGLYKNHPVMALIMMVLMFSMAGIPPFVGFMSKVWVVQALVHTHHIYLSVYAMLFALVGVYYYIRVVRVMYFGEEDQGAWLGQTRWSRHQSFLLSMNGLAVLGLGIFPGMLFSLCQSVCA